MLAIDNPPKKPLPILQGLVPVDRSRLGVDMIAGVTLAALAIPEVMGYTSITGMPVITGLYTIVLPPGAGPLRRDGPHWGGCGVPDAGRGLYGIPTGGKAGRLSPGQVRTFGSRFFAKEGVELPAIAASGIYSSNTHRFNPKE